MAKQESPTQMNNEPQAVSMSQGYDPTQYAMYQQPVDPNKGKAKWLTFEYASAMISVVLATLLTTFAITMLFNIWVGVATPTAGVNNFLTGVLYIDMVTPGADLILAGVVAVLLSVSAFVLFSRVSRAVPERKGYTTRTAYKIVTYGAMGAVVLPMAVLLAKIVTVLIASLIFIGLPHADKVYLSLYVGEFLPYVISLCLLAGVAWMVKAIISGRNTSRILTIIVLVASLSIMLASTITVAVKAHDTSAGTYRYRNSIDVRNLKDL